MVAARHILMVLAGAISGHAAPNPSSNGCAADRCLAFTSGSACGIPSPTAPASGSITCASSAPPAATETNARFRIEGDAAAGTIFEDCIASGPRNLTTASGGTHLCDGTNLGANPTPGGTLTTQIDAAGGRDGFDFDAKWFQEYEDYFVTRIAGTAEGGGRYWGVLRDLVFTSRGGCQEPNTNGDEGLWAFDAFGVEAFLKLDPEFQVVAAGSVGSVALTVRQTDGSSPVLVPASGAVVSGVTSGADGTVQIDVPTKPGCYQYKATRDNAIRSNTFYLTVLPAPED